MNIANETKSMLIEAKLHDALIYLWEKLSESKYSDTVLAIKSRFETLILKNAQGVFTPQDFTLEENKIRNDTINFLNIIQEEDLASNLRNVDRQLNTQQLVKNLLAILKETAAGFQSQGKLKHHLYNTISARLEKKSGLGYEDFFKEHHAKMTDEELKYHQSIRQFTEKVLSVYNKKALELIIGNDDLKKEVPRISNLERHLLVWLGKYETIFSRTPEIAVLYAGVSEQVPFPRGIETELEEYLVRLKGE